jgi:hypothetical protein
MAKVSIRTLCTQPVVYLMVRKVYIDLERPYIEEET